MPRQVSLGQKRIALRGREGAQLNRCEEGVEVEPQRRLSSEPLGCRPLLITVNRDTFQAWERSQRMSSQVSLAEVYASIDN